MTDSPPPAYRTDLKSAVLVLDKVLKGKPTKVSIGCVFSSSDGFAIGYILGVDDNVTDIKLDTLGIQGQLSFMNAEFQRVPGKDGEIECFRVGFTEKDGVFSGYMMQGRGGNDIIATENTDMAPWK